MGQFVVVSATDKPVPEGMVEHEIPAYTWAIFSGSVLPSSIQANMKYEVWLPIVKKE